MKATVRRAAGFTLVEVVVALGIFAVISGMMYGIFTAVKKQVAVTSTTNALSEKGQRILSYLEEDIRMLGFLLGPDARVPYCTEGVVPNNPNIIVHNDHTLSDGATNSIGPYDTFQFITSQPVLINETDTCFNGQKDQIGLDRKDYFLTTVGTVAAESSTLTVDATASCYNDIKLTCIKDENGNCLKNENGNNIIDLAKNSSSLVTFDSLQLSAAPIASNAPQVYYQVSSEPSERSLNLSTPLQQNLPDNSTVYTVRQYRYSVDTDMEKGSRTMVRTQWDKSCGKDTFRLVDSTGANNQAGGVDGFKVEFIYWAPLNPRNQALVTCSGLNPAPASCDPPGLSAFLPLSQLKAIRVWLLLRSDRSDPGHKDTATYTLGTTADKVVVGPFNDQYHRVLLNKTIEVKNLVSIT